jgi:hypothetical protein
MAFPIIFLENWEIWVEMCQGPLADSLHRLLTGDGCPCVKNT